MMKPGIENSSFDTEKDFFESFDFERFSYVFKRSRLWMLLFFVLIVAGAYLYVRYTKPLYKSDSVIKLKFQSEANVLGLTEAFNTQELSELSGEIELIKSKLFFSRVVEAADLDVSYHLYGRALTDERYKNSPFVVYHEVFNSKFYDYPFDLEIIGDNEFVLAYESLGEQVRQTFRFGEEIKNRDFSFLIEKTKYFSDDLKGDFYFTINSSEALIRYLQKNVEVIPENLNAKTIRVSLADHNRFKARDLVNLIDVLYITYTQEVKNKAIEQKLKFLDEQIQKSEIKLQEYESYFEKFIIENQIVDLDKGLSNTIDQLELLEADIQNLKLRIENIEKVKKQVMKGDLTIPDTFSDEDFPSMLLKSLEEYVLLVEERKLKAAAYNGPSIVIQRLDMQLTIAKSDIFSNIDGYASSLDKKLKLVQGLKSSLKRDLTQLPAQRTEYGKNNRVYELEEEFMLSLQQSKIELEITRAGAVAENVILSPASLPSEPIKPEKFLILAAAVVLGLVIGIVYLLIRYLAHNKIAGVKELEKLISVPVLGSVPKYVRKELDTATLVVGKDSKTSLSESFRTIRTNLDFINAGNGSKLLSVTSTVPGEGKTFIASNLGAIIALTNQKVCIVDLDMRRPKVHLALGGSSIQDGVSTILVGKSEVKSSIQKTEIENLYFIPAGPIPPNPSELLLQKDFSEFLNDLKKEFDFIILDTPPVGLVTDARLAMFKSDIQLYVARADYSKRSFTKVINDIKESEQASNLTVILNAVTYSANYAYNYGAYSGYYEDAEDKSVSVAIKNMF